MASEPGTHTPTYMFWRPVTAAVFDSMSQQNSPALISEKLSVSTSRRLHRLRAKNILRRRCNPPSRRVQHPAAITLQIGATASSPSRLSQLHPRGNLPKRGQRTSSRSLPTGLLFS